MKTSDSGYWQDLIKSQQILDALSGRVQVVRAMTPVRQVRGMSRAVVIDCDDGQRYVVKGRQVQRPLLADHVVGRLGAVIDAPVPEIALVEVSGELIVPGSFLEHFEPGIGHGSLFLDNCVDSPWIQYADDEVNRARFAALAVLYGWADAADQQFLYSRGASHLVYSVDHGLFFTGGSDWITDDLDHAPSAGVDLRLALEVPLGRGQLKSALGRLEQATDGVIVEIVAALPEEWGITMGERTALAQYLARRRDDLLASTLS